ncbi:MAG: DUF192 domain-containing protein [Candidatus Shapirobacteria bacterium]
MLKIWLFALTLILIFLFCRLFFLTENPTHTSVNFNGQKFDLEIAKTISQRTQGLSGRSSLCQNCGMIFVFSGESILPFWMKDTLIPLDLIWLNSQGQVVSIQTASPQPNTPITQLKNYKNSTPAKYVIELNANTAANIKLQVGDIVTLPKSL